jgi:hypothetical protein
MDRSSLSEVVSDSWLGVWLRKREGRRDRCAWYVEVDEKQIVWSRQSVTNLIRDNTLREDNILYSD